MVICGGFGKLFSLRFRQSVRHSKSRKHHTSTNTPNRIKNNSVKVTPFDPLTRPTRCRKSQIVCDTAGEYSKKKRAQSRVLRHTSQKYSLVNVRKIAIAAPSAPIELEVGEKGQTSSFAARVTHFGLNWCLIRASRPLGRSCLTVGTPGRPLSLTLQAFINLRNTHSVSITPLEAWDGVGELSAAVPPTSPEKARLLPTGMENSRRKKVHVRHPNPSNYTLHQTMPNFAATIRRSARSKQELPVRIPAGEELWNSPDTWTRAPSEPLEKWSKFEARLRGRHWGVERQHPLVELRLCASGLPLYRDDPATKDVFGRAFAEDGRRWERVGVVDKSATGGTHAAELQNS
ncbi:hypothetical protein GEV33_015127 [Tenebrio molitor]|uniref:Uncharacterized protein n=1 Tax=Tenebrio molitor TaxID=7067 RepID=A0A8J6H3U4_TENMO|nr:hypothetical protein GEV33_015127 [Tenebrio molitor]